jgi:TolB-like protein
VIETIAKRGYRLLPDSLVPGSPPIHPPAIPAPAPAALGRRAWLAAMIAVTAAGGAFFWLKPFSREADGISITVMPVNAIHKDPSQLSLANALAVDLVGALAKERRLHVTVRRPDSSQPRRGQRFYTYIDLQTAGGQLKANVEIMDVDTDQALWSRLYERAYDGTLSSQDALAAAIAKDITAALLAMVRTK